jgi:hypothetical protein
VADAHFPKRHLLVAVLTAGVASLLATPGFAADPVDLELVIAVDVSGSMDREEFLLQRNGYVEAIRHPEFVRAIAAGDYGRIAVTYVEWSGPSWQKTLVPWRVIDSAASAEAFAAALEAQKLDIGRGTSISNAIGFATALFDDSTHEARRQVIDVSGDGPNNYGPPVTGARDDAVEEGIVINGLPILIRPSPIAPDIVRYYFDCVVGGPGSFVLPVRRASEFSLAIRRKLILEVAALPAARIIQAVAEEPTDCLIGERMRELYADPYYPGLDN